MILLVLTDGPDHPRTVNGDFIFLKLLLDGSRAVGLALAGCAQADRTGSRSPLNPLAPFLGPFAPFWAPPLAPLPLPLSPNPFSKALLLCRRSRLTGSPDEGDPSSKSSCYQTCAAGALNDPFCP